MGFPATKRNFRPGRLIVLLGGFGLAWLLIAAIFDAREAAWQTEQQQFQARLAGDEASQAVAQQQTAVQQEKAGAAELLQALGGPLGTAVKDPASDIRQMLQAAAVACAPADTKVSVTVDRFTEFDVTLVLKEPVSVPAMAEISKKILANTLPYVFRLRFICLRRVLGQLDDVAIGSVTDWNTVSSDTVQALLVTAKDDMVAVNVNDTAKEPDQELAPEQVRLKNALEAFRLNCQEHTARLNGIVAKLTRAARMDTIQEPDLYRAETNWLETVEEKLSAEREFCLDQMPAYDQALRDQGLRPLLISIEERGFSALQPARRPLYGRLCDAISDYRQAVQDFMSAMDGCRSDWRTDPDTQTIRFTAQVTKDLFEAQSRKLQTGAKALAQANQDLADSVQASK